MATPKNDLTDDLNINTCPHLKMNITDTTPKQFCPLDVTKASLCALQERAWVFAATALDLLATHALQDNSISSFSFSSASFQASKHPDNTSQAPDDTNLEPKESRAMIVALLDEAVSTPLARNFFRSRMKYSTCKKMKWNYSLIVDEGDLERGGGPCISDYDSKYEVEEEEQEEDEVANDIMDKVHFCPTLPIRVWNGDAYVLQLCTHEAIGARG